MNSLTLDRLDLAPELRVGFQPDNKIRYGSVKLIPDLMGRIGINLLNKCVYSACDLLTRPFGKLLPVGDEVTQDRIFFRTQVVDGAGQPGLGFRSRQPRGK